MPGLGSDRVTIDGQQFFTHQDAIGSTVAVTDSTGALVVGYDYDAYGNVIATNQVDPDITGLERYGDGRLDPETGFYYLRARYYDPDLGIFTAVDPLDTLLGDPYQSRYSYVGGSPTAYSDPSGLRAWNNTIGQLSYGDLLFGTTYIAGEIAGAFGAESIRDATRDFRSSVNNSVLGSPITLHGTLDVLGMIPVVGEVADAANGLLYLAEGNYFEASLSFGAMIPFAGAAVTGAKFTRNAAKAVRASKTVARIRTGVDATASLARTGLDNVARFGRKGTEAFSGGIRNAAEVGRRADVPSSSVASRVPQNKPVLIDSNTTTSLRKDPTLRGRLDADETPVLSYVSLPELRNAASRPESRLAGVPGVARSLDVLQHRPDVNLVIHIRGLLNPSRRGIFGDAIIAAQAIETKIPFITDDKELAEIVRRLGGVTR